MVIYHSSITGTMAELAWRYDGTSAPLRGGHG